MSLGSLIDAGPVVVTHVIAASMALVVGPFALLRRKRDRLHKTLGYIWVVAMLVTAIGSFWISGIRLVGPFSPIHLLSVLSIISVIVAVRAAIQRNIRLHRKTMSNLYFMSVGIAGLFTLLPNRLMAKVLFDDPTWITFAISAAVWIAGFAIMWRKAPRAV